MKAGREKHLHYFALLDALGSGRCPCCSYTLTATERFYQSLLYENTNDRGIRRDFSMSHGFCSHHAYGLVRRGDGLSAAILYTEVLDHAVRRLDAGERNSYNVHDGCLLCDREKTWGRRFLDILHGFVDEPDVRRGLSSGGGLCIPHYRWMKRRYRPLPDWFVRLHRDRYRAHQVDLERYIASCNYSLSNRPQLDSQQQRIWRRVVDVLYGYEGFPSG